MYPKLARGYATQFLEGIPQHENVNSFADGPKAQRLIDTFSDASFAKRPTHAHKKLNRILRPTFGRAHVAKWEKRKKIVMAEAVSAAKDTRINCYNNGEEDLFKERTATLTMPVLQQNDNEIDLEFMVFSNISHHGIARLLEREIATPETIHDTVYRALSFARSLIMTMPKDTPLKDDSYDMLIPFEGGALVMASQTITTLSTKGVKSTSRLLSIRTWLSPKMIHGEKAERVEPIADFFEMGGTLQDPEFMDLLSDNMRHRPQLAGHA